jgi:hypothetical protein
METVAEIAATTPAVRLVSNQHLDLYGDKHRDSDGNPVYLKCCG